MSDFADSILYVLINFGVLVGAITASWLIGTVTAPYMAVLVFFPVLIGAGLTLAYFADKE